MGQYKSQYTGPQIDAGINAALNPDLVPTEGSDALITSDAVATVQKGLAPIETAATSANSYAIGDLLVWGGVLYKAKTAITAGDSFVVDTNIEATTIADKLNNIDTEITSNTDTTLTGLLTGNGSKVGTKSLDTSGLTNDADHVPTSGVVKSAITNVVIANPTLAGTESDLTALQVIGTKYKIPSGGGGLSSDLKAALLQLAAKVAYIDDQGQTYYNDLFDALYQTVSISAAYTQSGTVYDTDSLDMLKSDLVVTATYSDGSTSIIPAANYTLSGTLAEGTSMVTVRYGGKTTTFNVSVTWGYQLRSTFTSSGAESLDTGKQFATGSSYTIACEFNITSFASSIKMVFGNKGEPTLSSYFCLQAQQVTAGKYVWGAGIPWGSGINLVTEGHTIRFVTVLTVPASGTVSISVSMRDITASGSTKTFTNSYQIVSAVTGYSVKLGSQNSEENNGFTGSISDFVFVNSMWSSSDIATYLGGS